MSFLFTFKKEQNTIHIPGRFQWEFIILLLKWPHNFRKISMLWCQEAEHIKCCFPNYRRKKKIQSWLKPQVTEQNKVIFLKQLSQTCFGTVRRLQNERSHWDWGEVLPRCHHSGGSGSGGACSSQHPAAAPAGRWRHRGRHPSSSGRSSRPEGAASGGSQHEPRGHHQSRHARQLWQRRQELVS